MHGSKWYGSNLGPFKVHLRKKATQGRLEALYYYGQHDYLTQKQQGRRWTWSTLRPHFVNGVAVGSPSNLVSAIGAYAAAISAGTRLAFFLSGSERVSTLC